MNCFYWCSWHCQRSSCCRLGVGLVRAFGVVLSVVVVVVVAADVAAVVVVAVEVGALL